MVHTTYGDVTIRDGKATGSERAVNAVVNPLRVQYAKEVVKDFKMAATKKGWQARVNLNGTTTISKG